MLLVDFVSVKLCKLEKGQSWSGLGYDIANFTVPERGQMKSNFLRSAPVTKEEPVAEVIPEPQPVEAKPTEPIIELTDEEKEQARESEIEMMIARQSQQQTHLNLDCAAIFTIY